MATSRALDSYEAVQSEHHPDYNDAILLSRFDVALVHIDNPLSSTILNTYGIMPFVPVEPSQWEGVNALVTGNLSLSRWIRISRTSIQHLRWACRRFNTIASRPAIYGRSVQVL